MQDLVRYSVITQKNPREIVLLRGTGCKWKKCTFCDYHLDYSLDEQENFALNQAQLAKVTGIYQRLEVINSGSFCDLNQQTIQEIIRVCKEKHITVVHFECHWIHRKHIPAFRDFFAQHGISLQIKIGVETFDAKYREQILHKGIGVSDPAQIAQLFDECCLLFGLEGQTVQSMTRDIQIGLQHFNRVCVNIMVENSTPIKPNSQVIKMFCQSVLPNYQHNPRVDILMENTDFGVGGTSNE